MSCPLPPLPPWKNTLSPDDAFKAPSGLDAPWISMLEFCHQTAQFRYNFAPHKNLTVKLLSFCLTVGNGHGWTFQWGHRSARDIIDKNCYLPSDAGPVTGLEPHHQGPSITVCQASLLYGRQPTVTPIPTHRHAHGLHIEVLHGCTTGTCVASTALLLLIPKSLQDDIHQTFHSKQ